MTVGSDYANTEAYNLSTDLNVTPYYDDYEDKKEYYRILYKPGFAVQGRELTQMQTILQKQITRFGRHMFEEGTIVLPGNFQLFANNDSSASKGLDYVKVRDVDNLGNNITISNFNGAFIRGAQSNVTAYVNIIADGSELSANASATKTLYIDYAGASNASGALRKTFMLGETLVSNVGNLVILGEGTNAFGKGSAFRITEGVIFSKEHFVYFPEQEVILDRYSDNPTAKVGFNVIENIVDYTGDSTLLDPALESSNYSAPGADRLKLTAVLESRDYDDTEGVPNFTTLFTIKNGVIQSYNQRTQYSIMKDELAKRTFDESGDYYVSGLDVELRENADNGKNGGLISASQNPDANLISVRVNPGTAYVKGYEVGIIRPEYLVTPKSTNYINVSSQIVSAFMGSYVTANNMVGHLELDECKSITLLDTFNRRISDGRFTGVALGNTIGTATVMSIEYNSGILGTSDGRADIYLSDIRMLGSNSFSSVKSLYINDVDDNIADFGADIVPDVTTNTTVLREPFNAPLLYYTGSNFTRKVKDGKNGDAERATYYYTTTIGVEITNSGVGGYGTFTASLSGSDIPYTGTLSTTDKRELFLSLEATPVDVAMPGTFQSIEGGTSNVINGSIDSRFRRLTAGEKIKFTGHSNTYTILTTPTSDTVLQLAESAIYSGAPAISNGSTMYRHYSAGSYIDLTSLGMGSGTTRSVSVDEGTQLLRFGLGEVFPASTPAALSFRVASKDAVQTRKELRPSRYVKINCAFGASNTTGPFSLGFSDVYRIKSIVKKSSSFPTSNTDGTIVTSQFIFDNGQKDTLYDTATIKPTSALSTTDRLLVELDYFVPDFSLGKGFFTVDSYPANDTVSLATTISTAEIPIYTSPSSGKRYDLRNHIDFRPVKTNIANDTTDPATATVDPAKSTVFNFTESTLALVSPSSEINFDYSYYVARKDIVHVNKNKEFSITEGQPASLPITPQIPEDELAIAELTIAPFPSISPYYAKLIGRQDIASSSRRLASVRQTMRDLGVMKNRIANLEYYASLSLLEKNAADMLIQDENGMDRFKNGIFVDTFRDHSLGDSTNSDYRIVVDPAENSIRPLYSMQSINYDYISGDANIERSGDLVTLKYDEVEYANVSSVTATLNTERSTYSFVGNMTLVPESDIWIDTVTLPPNVVEIQDANLDGLGDAQQSGGVTTTWNAWKTYVSGYTVYQGEGATKSLVGTYTNLTDAQAAAQNIRTTSLGATLETTYVNERTGSEAYTFVDNDSTSTGSKVVNTDIVPYIRPQTIVGSVTGIKPYAKYKLFFDNIDMTSYVRPVTYAEFLNAGNITSWTYNVGSDILADANGELWFRLSLPNTDNLRFTVGSKLVRITDSLTNSEEETSFAEKAFFAQGTIQTKQDTILSTRQVDVRDVPLFETNSSNSFETLPPLTPPRKRRVKRNFDLPPMNVPNNRSCLAYVMPIKVPNGEEGIFLTSVDIFCAQKHPTLGMWCEVRELDSGGGITGNAVPFSAVWFTNAEVPISTNGIDNRLNVKFESPIFLYANKSYAFIIHPEAANPNYYFWISRIGQEDRNTGKQVTGRAYNGATFTTNNDTIWVIVEKVDLTCKWYRASFHVGEGTFEIGNQPKEKLYLNNIVGSLEGFGEPFVTGDRLTFSGGTTPLVGDFVIGNSSGVNARVISISSGTYKTSNIRFESTEVVTVLNGTTGELRGASPSTATISGVDRGVGFLEYYKNSPTGTQMILTSSNGKFSAGETIFDISDEGSANIASINNLRYSVIDFEPAVINFTGTGTSYEMQTYSNSSPYTADAYFTFDASENYTFDEEKAVFSRSNEIALLSSNYSNKIKSTLKTVTPYLSPVFDLRKSHSIIVDNLVNSNTVGEAATQGGQLFNKYISKIVTLADYQDAEDMNVFLTAYRPPDTDVKVWMKLLNGGDSDSMSQKTWIEMEKSYGGDVTYSSIANKNDFKEYKYLLPARTVDTGGLDANGIFTYKNTANVEFSTFKSFQIKVGLVANNSAVVPRVADLRTIALQI
jgi:hypothetical protein